MKAFLISSFIGLFLALPLNTLANGRRNSSDQLTSHQFNHRHPPRGHFPHPPLRIAPPYDAYLPPPYSTGWFAGGPWDRGHHWRPNWYFHGMTFPQFVWPGPRFPGLWQCTSYFYSPFENIWWSFYGTGPNQDIAAHNALYACGGPYFIEKGCYIPPGYCRL